MFNPMAGVLNYILTKTGMSDQGVNWFGNPTLAWISVLVVSAWRYTPYFGLVILAARKEVPEDFYEVARIDGAGSLSQFIYVTAPLIWKVIFFTSVLMFVRVAYDFVVVYVLTRGGPVGATEIISILTFNIAFDTGRMGLGVAAPLLMFPLFAPLILVVTKSMVRSIVGIK
jgi:ABC-type sugar transport system permease subunit